MKPPRQRPRSRQKPAPTAPEARKANGISGIDLAIISQVYDQEIDETMRSALRAAMGFANDEIPNGGPMIEYIAAKRAAAITALKGLADIDPTDVVRVRAIQLAVRDYMEPMRYLIGIFGIFAERDLDQLEDDEPDGHETGDTIPVDE